ncbi:MAG: exonuclease subunit SbcD [Brevinema sp.]
MKILCTADWHIGKKLSGFSRLDEQVKVLSEICTIAETERPDAIIIAGDCFDTTSPTPEQYRLFVRTMAQLTRGGECPVLAIAGNHDSPLLLSSTEAFASQVGVVILGRPQDTPVLENVDVSSWNVELSDVGMLQIHFKNHQKSVRFLLSPYADARRLKKDLGTEDTDIKAWEILQNQWERQINADVYNVLIAHSTVREEQSDQEIEEDEGEKKIGGINAIPLENLPNGIDFLILGHIHSAKKLKSSKIEAFYTGSPLIYSQNEIKKQKSVLIIELNEEKSHRFVPLSPGRDIKKVMLDSMENAQAKLAEVKDHFVEIIWTAPRFLEGFERRQLEESHPYILNIISSQYLPSNFQEMPAQTYDDSPITLFKDYFSYSQKGREAPDSILKLFNQFSTGVSDEKNSKKRGFSPKTLSIEGFFSYKNRVSIDFSNFGSEGVFGIFGEVGSGKSALIEAIILAIYSVTERVPRKKTDAQSFPPGYNIMNLDSDSLYIEFSFEIIGEKGLETYKITLSGKRGKKSEDALKISRQVFIDEDGEWIPLDTNIDGETLLGISYNDFRKTIILQQRDFMGFIEAKPTENAEMLQRLFRLDRYDLSPKIKEYSAGIITEKNKLNEQFEQLEHITPETKISLEKEEVELQKQIEELQNTIQTLRIIDQNRLARVEQAKNRKEALDKQQKLIEDISKIEADISVFLSKLEEISPKIEEVNQNITHIDASIAQLQPLSDAENSNIKRNIIQLEGKISRIKKYKEEIATLFQQSGFTTLEEFKSYGEKLKLEKENLIAMLSVEKGVELLKDGSPCPLCGSLDHPKPCPVDPERQHKLVKIEEELLEKREQYKAIQTMQKNIASEQEGYTEETLNTEYQRFKIIDIEQDELKSKLKSFENSKKEYQNSLSRLEKEQMEQSNQLSICQTRIEIFNKELQDITEKLAKMPIVSDQDEDPDLEENISKSEKREKELLNRQGSLRTEKSLVNEQLERKQTLVKRLEEIQLLLDEVNIMENLFWAKGFVKFVAHKHLARLCYSANKRFSAFTRGRFLLQEPDSPDKGLVLIDLLNGGRKRDLTTLSGGQSFQAALALSASLADESGAGGKFFFIDEGFGSLDEASLDAVMDTLVHLVHENHRLIGLISHVGVFQERLDSYINVTLSPKDGSSIEVVLPQ